MAESIGRPADYLNLLLGTGVETWSRAASALFEYLSFVSSCKLWAERRMMSYVGYLRYAQMWETALSDGSAQSSTKLESQATSPTKSTGASPLKQFGASPAKQVGASSPLKQQFGASGTPVKQSAAVNQDAVPTTPIRGAAQMAAPAAGLECDGAGSVTVMSALTAVDAALRQMQQEMAANETAAA
mmetsp:Transcript_19015/g.44364  ORF Transcript_19015/g.44364 Transcript_19015/m.44364 type:complete len:186 (+) Transcript_19015:57-614(+)